MPAEMRMASLIPIRKMDRAVKFYTKKLDAKVVYRARGSMRNMWAAMKVGGVDVWFIVPEKREKRTLSYHALLVKDIRKYVALLQRRGVKFSRPMRMSSSTKVEGPIAFDPYGASAFFQDSEGNLLMAWQNNPPM